MTKNTENPLQIVHKHPQANEVLIEVGKIFEEKDKPEFAGKCVFDYIDGTNVPLRQKEALKQLAQSYINTTLQDKVNNVGRIVA